MPIKIDIPSHVPISAIVIFTGQPARNIQQWAVEGKIPKSEGRKGYPFVETVKAVRELLQNRDGNLAEEKEWKRQQIKAESESAMVKLAKERGELMFTEDAGRLWDDGLTQIKVIIRGASYIPEKQRDQILSDIAGVKLSDA